MKLDNYLRGRKKGATEDYNKCTHICTENLTHKYIQTFEEAWRKNTWNQLSCRNDIQKFAQKSLSLYYT